MDKDTLRAALARWLEKMGEAHRLEAEANTAYADALDNATAVLRDSGHATLGEAFSAVFDGNIPPPILDLLRETVPGDTATLGERRN